MNQASPLSQLPNPVSEAVQLHAAQVDTTVAELKANLAQLDAKVAKLDKWESDLDTEFPWRRFERECDPHEWFAGWKRIGVDRGWLANAAENIEDPAMANAMAALIQIPNSDMAKNGHGRVPSQRAQDRVETLCLASFGGNADKF